MLSEVVVAVFWASVHVCDGFFPARWLVRQSFALAAVSGPGLDELVFMNSWSRWYAMGLVLVATTLSERALVPYPNAPWFSLCTFVFLQHVGCHSSANAVLCGPDPGEFTVMRLVLPLVCFGLGFCRLQQTPYPNAPWFTHAVVFLQRVCRCQSSANCGCMLDGP